MKLGVRKNCISKKIFSNLNVYFLSYTFKFEVNEKSIKKQSVGNLYCWWSIQMQIIKMRKNSCLVASGKMCVVANSQTWIHFKNGEIAMSKSRRLHRLIFQRLHLPLKTKDKIQFFWISYCLALSSEFHHWSDYTHLFSWVSVACGFSHAYHIQGDFYWTSKFTSSFFLLLPTFYYWYSLAN